MIVNLFLGDQIGDRIGGGYTFLRNFQKGLEQLGHKVSSTNFDISMLCGPTMASRDQWNAAAGKPRILRLDGIPEDFRNRGTAWPRMKEYSLAANMLIFQSNFSNETVGGVIKRHGEVIHNGVDTSVFNKNGPASKKFGNPSVAFVLYRDDPCKRFNEVIDRFRQFKVKNPKATITFIGTFPKTQVLWNGKTYDFGMLDWKKGVDWEYTGGMGNRTQLANALRSFDYIAFPSFNDSCPNTLIEAMSCGCKPLWISDYGSSNEIVDLFAKNYDFSLKHMVELYLEKFNKLKK
jgi:glycosyltransferase involved in cell wall biosynthesis